MIRTLKLLYIWLIEHYDNSAVTGKIGFLTHLLNPFAILTLLAKWGASPRRRTENFRKVKLKKVIESISAYILTTGCVDCGFYLWSFCIMA